jgi:hypothetical protein
LLPPPSTTSTRPLPGCSNACRHTEQVGLTTALLQKPQGGQVVLLHGNVLGTCPRHLVTSGPWAVTRDNITTGSTDLSAEALVVAALPQTDGCARLGLANPFAETCRHIDASQAAVRPPQWPH